MASVLRLCLGLLLLTPALTQAARLEIPGHGANLSGIGVISGWKCEATGTITVRLDGGTPIPMLYGSERGDTRGVCGDSANGFVAIFNWGLLADGLHTAVAADGAGEFARSTFTVTTFGEEFVEGASGECRIPDFPAPGESALFAWNEATQGLVLVPEPPASDPFAFPLRALHVTGRWGTNELVVEDWEAAGRIGPLIPPDYLAWLTSLHVNWIGLSVGLHYDDSMDSTVERVYSSDVDIPTFSDTVLRQLLQEFRGHGINVYLTLAFQAHEAETSTRPVRRWELGDPGDPETGVPDTAEGLVPEFWPWRPDHPDHQRFVAEFWETYTQQAVHFARLAEEEGVGLYSLGTETERLFRTRSGGARWPNDFGQELQSMVARVRAVYSGLVTYDMHYDALITADFYDPGSTHLWEDLDLDIVGISAYFPLTASRPSTVLSVAALQASYERIFQDYLLPLAARNPDRPLVFLEYGATDTLAAPRDHTSDFEAVVFADANGNGVDDGRETQANIYQALFNTMVQHPGVLNGVFFWGNWIASDERWASYWAHRRTFAIRDKPAEAVVRAAYDSYRQE